MIQFIIGALAGAYVVSESAKSKHSTSQEPFPKFAIWIAQHKGYIHIECPTCLEVSMLNSHGEIWNCSACSKSMKFTVGYSLLEEAKHESKLNVIHGLRSAFFLLGAVSNADGEISTTEVVFMNFILDNFFADEVSKSKEFDSVIFLGREKQKVTKEYFLDVFQKGINSSSGEYLKYAKKFTNVYGTKNKICSDLLIQMCKMAYSDKHIHENELKIISDINNNFLGFTNKDVEEIFLFLIGDTASKEQGARSVSLKESYEILCCADNEDFEVVKNNYKKLCLKFHPDIIIGKDLPDEFVQFAAEKFKAINEAFQKIQSHHSKNKAA